MVQHTLTLLICNSQYHTIARYPVLVKVMHEYSIVGMEGWRRRCHTRLFRGQVLRYWRNACVEPGECVHLDLYGSHLSADPFA